MNQQLITTTEKALAAKRVDITKTKQIDELATLAGNLQRQIDAFWGAVSEQMDARNVEKLNGAWGYATFATRKNWSLDETVPPRFFKKVPNTKALALADQLGKLPKGVKVTTSSYFTKRVK